MKHISEFFSCNELKLNISGSTASVQCIPLSNCSTYNELQRSAQQLSISRERIEQKFREISCGQEGSEKKINCPAVEYVRAGKTMGRHVLAKKI
jgi:hypothetical protein